LTGAQHTAELEVALEAALRAGAKTLDYFRTQLDVTHKTPDQPVTEADLVADRMLREMLQGAFPTYGWLSEETPDSPDRLGRRRVWIVDPIDGTRSFIAGRPEYTISIGLVEDGEPVVGVVHNPPTGELYWAVRGDGARFRRGSGSSDDALAMANELESGGARLALASRSEIGAGLEIDGWSLTPSGSTAYKLARVAGGAAHAFVSRRAKSEWDVCAGALIVQEAGGVATDLAGRSLRYNQETPSFAGVVAAARGAHRELVERFSDRGMQQEKHE
jgi:myo-inositol-1(or 4)-monophosphatase